MNTYEKKYKETLERAKTLYENANGMILKKWVEQVFPELTESDDEKVKKIITLCLEECVHSDIIRDYEKDDAIVWLEKQKSTLPKWKYKKDNTPLLRDSIILNKYGCVAKSPSGAIVSDVWVLDYDELAKLPKEEIEKQGKLKPIDKVEPKFKVGDWIAYNHNPNLPPRKIIQITNEHYVFNNGSFEIKTLEADWHLWTIQDAKDGDVLAYVTDEEDLWIMIFWSLYEPYEGHVHYHALLANDNFSGKGTCCICINNLKPATKEQRDIFFTKMSKELRKIEQKSADKIQAQFHEDDWITDGQLTYKILGVTGKSYELHLYNDDYCHFETDIQSVDKHYRLWSIQDTKDGDVLVGSYGIFIFMNKSDGYCGVLSDNTFIRSTGNNGWTEGLHPATKEQRDLLFSKMKDAGYEFNFEKKELKKFHIIDEGKDEMDYCFTKMMNGEKVSSEWSEDNEKMLNRLIGVLDSTNKEDYHEGWEDIFLPWLKSLKDRVQPQNRWKPSKEQIIALRWVLNNIPYNKFKEEISGLLDQIKDLFMEEYY